MSTEMAADLVVRGSEFFHRHLRFTKASLRYCCYVSNVTDHPQSILVIIFVKVGMLLHRKETLFFV
jgi:hypothetical protein